MDILCTLSNVQGRLLDGQICPMSRENILLSRFMEKKVLKFVRELKCLNAAHSSEDIPETINSENH